MQMPDLSPKSGRALLGSSGEAGRSVRRSDAARITCSRSGRTSSPAGYWPVSSSSVLAPALFYQRSNVALPSRIAARLVCHRNSLRDRPQSTTGAVAWDSTEIRKATNRSAAA